MEIGEPKRVITIEPLEEPAPTKAPPPERQAPAPEREREPVEPAKARDSASAPLTAGGSGIR